MFREALRMSRFTPCLTPIQGLLVVDRMPFRDERGFFSRLFCREEFSAFKFEGVSQIGHSMTRERGTVRGLHFQCPPHADTKFVSCVAGAIFDVAVDMRPDSSTYLQWHAEVLSAANFRSMLIPRGFGHGFQTLTEDCLLIYLHDEAYEPSSEGGLNALDPRLSIAWPLPIGTMSKRDREFLLIGS
jgi:dTDP-4-dehydrorhamnose 3,5-epimerase